jgi:hypothetical protein
MYRPPDFNDDLQNERKCTQYWYSSQRNDRVLRTPPAGMQRVVLLNDSITPECCNVSPGALKICHG